MTPTIHAGLRRSPRHSRWIDKSSFIWYNLISWLCQQTNLPVHSTGRGPWESVTGREIALVREINLSVILNCLRETSPLSRAQLAEITGLNKTTVSSLVRELITELVIFSGVMSLASGVALVLHDILSRPALIT